MKRFPKSSKAPQKVRGLSKEDFDKWWVERWFWTTLDGRGALFHEVHRWILTQNMIDVGLFYIINLAFRVEDLRKAMPHEPLQKLGVNQKKLLDAIATIKNSPLSSALVPGTEEVVRTKPLDDRVIVKESIRPYVERLKSEPKDIGRYVADLATLDAFPSTNPSKHVQSFFISLLSDRFRRTTGQPNFPMVGKIVEMCFGEKLKVGTLEQRCRDFTRRFPYWQKVAAAIYKMSPTTITGLPESQP